MTSIGIDLGTAYSCVGVWQDGSVKIITNDQGNRTTPSYVSFTDTTCHFGEAAKSNPQNTVFDAKRLIGRKFSDPLVQADMNQWPFNVVQNEGDNPIIQVEYKGEKKTFTPEEISAMVLIKMKETAESFLGKAVDNAVISVPANFTDSQRQATKDAAAIAKLNVQLINDPISAAIAYCLNKREDSFSEKIVLIFDLGAGTFDVSIVAIDDGIIEVKATGGDPHLGGQDFDTNMVNYFVEHIKQKHKINLIQQQGPLQRLRASCERAKRALSSSTQASIEIDSLYGGIDFYSSMTRDRFDELNSYLFQRCIRIVEKVIQDAGFVKQSINEIILVGGSTHITKIRHLLQDFFNGKVLDSSIDVNEVVAYGAAVQAAILSNQGGNKFAGLDLLLLDVTPLSIGYETPGGVMTNIFPRYTTFPCKKSQIFTTHYEQTDVLIQVYEGEAPLTKDNNLLGAFRLYGIPPAPIGVPQIQVAFDVDANGILSVSAEDKASGKTIQIINEKGRLSKEQIEQMAVKVEEYRAETKRYQSNYRLESYVLSINQLTTNNKEISEDDRKKIKDAIQETIEWLASNQDATNEEFDNKLETLVTLINPIIANDANATNEIEEMD